MIRTAVNIEARVARIRRNLTQTDLAKLAGLDRSKISRAETAAGPSSPADLARIAQALGRSVDELFPARPPRSHPRAPSNDTAT
jgi:transcriptional regulator with XRE-family HTH domain